MCFRKCSLRPKVLLPAFLVSLLLNRRVGFHLLLMLVNPALDIPELIPLLLIRYSRHILGIRNRWMALIELAGRMQEIRRTLSRLESFAQILFDAFLDPRFELRVRRCVLVLDSGLCLGLISVESRSLRHLEDLTLSLRYQRVSCRSLWSCWHQSAVRLVLSKRLSYLVSQILSVQILVQHLVLAGQVLGAWVLVSVHQLIQIRTWGSRVKH